LFNCPVHGQDQIPEIYSPWADQLAFSAKHAFSQFSLDGFRVSPADHSMKLPDVKIGKLRS
jgi:hypothetical protein